MDDPNIISQLREEIFRKVAEAAQKGLSDQVARLASLAKNCDSAIETMKGLEAEVERIREGLKNMEHPATNKLEISSLRPPLDMRQKGLEKQAAAKGGAKFAKIGSEKLCETMAYSFELGRGHVPDRVWKDGGDSLRE